MRVIFLSGGEFLQSWRECECYHSLTANQHQEGHTVPKQVIMIATSISSRYSLSTALCESIRYQAKSKQHVYPLGCGC